MRKLIVLLAFMLMSITTIGQKQTRHGADVPTWNSEKMKAHNALETKIKKFIREKNGKYRLSDQKIQEVRQMILSEDKNFDFVENIHYFQMMLEKVEKNELRKLFFENHRTGNSPLASRPKPGDVRFTCDNGGFESQLTNDYDFFKNEYVNGISIDCYYNTSLFDTLTVLPTVNDWLKHATITTTNSTSPVFDQALAAHSIFIPVANTGNHAIKLNNSLIPAGDLNQATKMIKTFITNDSLVYYSFLFVCENPTGHDSIEQPRFIARIYDKNGVLLDKNCIVSNVNNTSMFRNATPDDTMQPLLYTEWQCANLQIPASIYNAVNESDREIRLEFSVNDCTKGQHFGTVYIDDICTTFCDNPVFGSLDLNLNPTEIVECPTFPIQVCGTYRYPHSIQTPFVYATLDNDDIVLEILDDTNTVVGTVTNPILSSNPPPAQNTFCFEVNESDFGLNPFGNYEYRVAATFMADGVPFAIDTESSNPEEDVKINNCCENHLTITANVTASGIDNKQAELTITATNAFDDNAAGIYHAGEEVLMTNGFSVTGNAIFHAYNEECNFIFQAKAINDNPVTKHSEIQLVPIFADVKTINMFPNPAKSIVTIDAPKNSIREISIASLDGRIVYNLKPDADSRYDIDLHNFKKGIYLVTIQTDKGEFITSKLIKN